MRTVLKVLVAVAAAGAVFAISRGATTVEPPPTIEELRQLIGTEWYSVRIFGQPSGYACIQTELTDSECGPGLRVTEDLKLLVSLAGRELQATKSQVTIYDQQLRPASIELVKDELGRTARVSARLQGSELIVRTSSPEVGAPPAGVRRLTVSDDLASDLLIAVRLLRGQLDIGESFSYEVYDPEVDVIDRHSVTVDRWETLNGADTLVVNAVSEQLGVEVVSWIDSQGRMLRQAVPGLMDLTLERVSEEEALASLAPFEIRSQIAVEHHLPLVRSLREVRLRFRRAVGPAGELIPETRRQSVVADGDEALVTISREVPPRETLPLPIRDEALAEHLRPTKYVQSDDPRLVEAARGIIEGETDAWGAAQMLCSWVNRNMRAVSSEPRPITALECLESMQGDCTEHAILLAALGRAVGLPTRLITGLAHVGGKFGYHAWTEVYVGQWVEMDPAWGETTADAGHVLIYASALDEASYARACLATGRTIGAVEIDVLGYVAADGRAVEFEEE